MDTRGEESFGSPEIFTFLESLDNRGEIKDPKNANNLESLINLGNVSNFESSIDIGKIDNLETNTDFNLREEEEKKFKLKYQANREDILKRIIKSLREDSSNSETNSTLQNHIYEKKKHQVKSIITVDNSNVEILKNMSTTYGLLKIFLITFFGALLFFASIILIKYVYKKCKAHMENRMTVYISVGLKKAAYEWLH
ncbi:hypothetical protein PGO_134060 [Plasmodium gonderi]|uniref:Uncharacterized protein n=1 Tax=Plasmodium gonderi TaxID=77519 RepID=A0A1Y1JT60_PLAGO|nr:hypothetical protein PGO_134060 [Plasmodium gonderi]GAW83134.1 hypothetical protein PGO_134060 [Plasmodium gonderi]